MTSEHPRQMPLIGTILTAFLLAGVTGCASMTPTQQTERAFTIMDISAPTIDRNKLLADITKAIQANVSRASINREIPPAQLPDQPARMRMIDPLANSPMGALIASHGGSTKVPVCDNALMTVSAKDTSGSEYGDTTDLFICVVGYKTGYQVNVHATHVSRTGGFSLNTLGGSLTKSIAGGWSQYIPRTMNAIRSAMANQGTVTIVDSYIPESFRGAFNDQVQSLQVAQ